MNISKYLYVLFNNLTSLKMRNLFVTKEQKITFKILKAYYLYLKFQSCTENHKFKLIYKPPTHQPSHNFVAGLYHFVNSFELDCNN